MEGGLKGDHLVPNFCIRNDKHTGSSTDADGLVNFGCDCDWIQSGISPRNPVCWPLSPEIS